VFACTANHLGPGRCHHQLSEHKQHHLEQHVRKRNGNYRKSPSSKRSPEQARHLIDAWHSPSTASDDMTYQSTNVHFVCSGSVCWHCFSVTKCRGRLNALQMVSVTSQHRVPSRAASFSAMEFYWCAKSVTPAKTNLTLSTCDRAIGAWFGGV
jgi:hypothetical protein